MPPPFRRRTTPWSPAVALVGALLVAPVGALVAAPPDGAAPAAADPHVVFDAARADAALPSGQGATVARAQVEGRACAQVDVAGGSAWARIYFRGVPADLRPFAALELDLRGAATGALQELQLQIADAQDRNALVRLAAPKASWETRRVRLADLAAPPGFDPTTVKLLLLNWYKPLAASIQVARVAFVPGEGGWRLGAEELTSKVFGERRAREARLLSTEHFDVWSDAPARAVKTLGEELEKEAAAAAGLFGVGPESLSGFRLPVYAFKSPGDYRDYCQRVLGWNEEQARRRPAVGTAGEIVLALQGGFMPDRAQRVGRAVFAHVFGPGGGAWLQEGAGELVVRSLEGKQPVKELASRIKGGDLWPLPSLIGADSLVGTGTNTAATYDYRPVLLHAATVVEFLLRRPPAEPPPGSAPGPEQAGRSPGERVQARLKALAALRSRGEARLADVARVLGQPLAELEAAWRAWALAR